MQNSQLELFSQTNGYNKAKIDRANNSFFKFIRNYEKVVLIIIGFVLISIASFSLGVKKGKKQIYQPPIPLNINLQNIPKQNIQNHPTIEKQDIIKQPSHKESLQNYTVQVASYQSKISAQKEVELLRKRGFLPSVLSKGKYNVVCIGKFSDRKTAESLLLELKKRYKDCLIRRL